MNLLTVFLLFNIKVNFSNTAHSSFFLVNEISDHIDSSCDGCDCFNADEGI